jgi:predicted Fe-Mo cluster-binding NifX family protein
MDSALTGACDAGKPLVDSQPDSPTAQALAHAFEPLIRDTDDMQQDNPAKELTAMKIAIPLVDGKLSSHFGHCEQFALVEIDPGSKEIKNQMLLMPPAHEPGVLPAWLAEQGAGLIIAGGMGRRAQDLFQQNNIEVIVGASADQPEVLVRDYMAGRLQCGQNICDH